MEKDEKRKGGTIDRAVQLFYECDIEKNVECTKENCISNGGNCRMTTRPFYAKLDGSMRMVVPVNKGELPDMEGVEDAD